MTNRGSDKQNNYNELIDKEKFSILIEKHKLSMYRLAKSILIKEHDAEDAVCTAVYKAYISRNTLRDINSFKSWLLKIVANESYSVFSKNKKITFINKDIEASYEEERYDSCSDVWDAIQNLDDKYRSVLVLFYYDDLSIKNISEVLRLSQSTVKVRLFRARQLLKEKLISEGGIIINE